MRRLFSILTITALCLFALALWMHRWNYGTWVAPNGQLQFPMRESRVTGAVEIFAAGEWVQLGGVQRRLAAPDSADVSACRRLDERPALSPDSFAVYRARCDSVTTGRAK